MAEHPSFEVSTRPERRYPASGGVEYEGDVVFVLRPSPERSTDALDALLAAVLAEDRYVRGDFFDLPAPVYLVRDRELGTSFRAVVRDGELRLHVLPHTDTEALAALYDAVVATSDADWAVERRGEPDDRD